MKSAIVTGANGFVGSAVVHYLVSKGVDVCAVVHNNNYSRLTDLPKLKIISCEMSDIKELETLIDKNYEYFYQLAWVGSAGPERTNYELQLNNAKWSLDAIQVAKKIGCTKFVFAGTIMEHETIEATYLDGNKPGPAYIYGAGKTVTHLMAAPFASKVGIDLIWVKITNAYGPGELSPRLVNTTIKKCIDGMTPEFTSGVQNYDFVYIDDVAEAFYLIGKNGIPFHDYIIGSSKAKPLKEFLLEMQKSIAPNMTFKFGNIKYTGVNLPLSIFNTEKTEKETGFKAKISFGEGCIRTKDWLSKRCYDDSKI